MPLILYELCAQDRNRLFSPYCWRAVYALAHKGLEAERRPLRFTELDEIAFTGQRLVPVLVDGDRAVHDSWQIAAYLDEAYPDRPLLFESAAAKNYARFIACWTDTVLVPVLARIILADISQHLEGEDLRFFREDREASIGMTLEQFVAGAEARVPEYRAALAPLRRTLKTQAFIGGDRADFADYLVVSMMQWPRCVSDRKLLEPGDPAHDWQERTLDLFDGLGRRGAVGGVPVGAT